MGREWYVFTFGVGHPYGKYVVKIYGTYREARTAMFVAHGKLWAFQYGPEEGDELIKKFGYKILAEFSAEDFSAEDFIGVEVD